MALRTYILLGVALILFGAYYWKQKRARPYCWVHILERRGDIYIDHPIPYKAFVHSVKDVAKGRIVKWIKIPKLKLNWRLPRSKELTFNTKGARTLFLVWLGGNNLAVIKPKTIQYKIKENKEGLLIATPHKQPFFKIQREAMDFLNINLTETIVSMTKKEEGKWSKFAPHFALALTAIAIIAMIAIASKNYSKAMAEFRVGSEKNDDAVDKLINIITPRKVDSNTEIKTDPDRVQQAINEGGG